MLTAFKVLPSWRSGVNRFGRTDAFDCLLLKEGWEQGDATERNSRREETRHSSADVKIGAVLMGVATICGPVRAIKRRHGVQGRCRYRCRLR